jgi:hypothetical protein
VQKSKKTSFGFLELEMAALKKNAFYGYNWNKMAFINCLIPTQKELLMGIHTYL